MSKKSKSDTLPVSKPLAQNTNQCDNPQEQPTAISHILDCLQRARRYSPIAASVLSIQIETGARVSDVLGIQWQHIDSLGRVELHERKTGKKRLITLGEERWTMKVCRAEKRNPFEGVSRFYIYREYRKLGVVFQSETSQKASITHAPRHIGVLASRQAGFDERTIQASLNHSNEKITRLYGKAKTTDDK